MANTKLQSREDSVDSAANLYAGQLESIFDRCDEEIECIREEVRGDNEEIIQSVEWEAISDADVLDHPEVRKLLLANIRRFVDHLTYMND